MKFKHWLKEYWLFLITVLGMAILLLLGLAYIGVRVYCFITYGDKPITEVPSWALPFMFGE